MEKNTLIINIGSSSKKYHLYHGDNFLLDAHFEHDKDGFVVTYAGDSIKEIVSEVYENGLSHFCDVAKKSGFISDDNPVSVIGIRIVAPGVYFSEHRVVDEGFMEKLGSAAEKDPVHINPTLEELNHVIKIFPNIKIVAVSDSAFHSTLFPVAKRYAIPEKLAKENDLYRFGFHGISVSSIVEDLINTGGLGKRTIVCHLGSGSSITALLEGKSVDTSMGYSPLEGVVMSSRVGNVDAGVVLSLGKKIGNDDLQKMFYSECGLLALSGLSSDMRILLDAEKDGNEEAKLAVDSFVYSVKKYIAAYTAVLGGIDTLVFSGTIGERSWFLRERVSKDLSYLNINIDIEKNKKAQNGDDISLINSQQTENNVHIYVLHANEASQILKIAKTMIK